ncbi:amylo-alpha-1,6-glucosidase [Robbsia andropogonis]|uniref:amylo-alpha-1,6-glucosidase n=1 Tax=Robbsia andropogonis TaxID=28092 RepID=UPI000466A835|nr:amylo-alpha-1,6-glucosidase [Robbsia andropogonis]
MKTETESRQRKTSRKRASDTAPAADGASAAVPTADDSSGAKGAKSASRKRKTPLAASSTAQVVKAPDVAADPIQSEQTGTQAWELLRPDAGDPRASGDEWLEADGLGGFASGTRYGVRTRRYHALLLCASLPPSGRLVLMNGVEAWIETAQGDVIALTTQAYAPDTLHPDGWRRLRAFSATPWPTWRYALGPVASTATAKPGAKGGRLPDDGDSVIFEVCSAGQSGDVILRWSAHDRTGVLAGARLRVRPLLSIRDYHALHKRNDTFDFTPSGQAGRISWRPYKDRPAVSVLSNGTYQHDPEWFDRFRYHDESLRGLDDTEDLASPGIFTFAFGDPGDQALMVLRAGDSRDVRVREYVQRALFLEQTARAEQASRITDVLSQTPRQTPPVAKNDVFTASPYPLGDPLAALSRAVHHYIVERGGGATVIAGYPWFTDWGRDTFIALRGIALATGNVTLAGEILREWAAVVDHGMLPNRFTDDANPDAPAEYNAVDASLWFIVAAHAFLNHHPDGGTQDGQAWAMLTNKGSRSSQAAPGPSAAATGTTHPSVHPLQPVLHRAMEQIVEGYAAGTRFGIHADTDGLLFAGVPGSQLTWMDARIGVRPVTPRIGKPVEIQALWINALRIVGVWVPKWRALAAQAQASFTRRFIPAPDAPEATSQVAGILDDVQDRGLYDSVDADGEAGRVDASLRPNQIFAVGGLPYPVVDLPTARAIVAHVERHLWTPMGLRTLAASDPRYIGRYEGPPDRRDNAYHQGTVWPWLTGPFVEAWLRVHAHGHAQLDLDRVADEARRRFIAPLDAHLASAGIGHISEIADGDAPHTPRGAPFQAWSLAERLRLEVLLRHPSAASTVQFI